MRRVLLLSLLFACGAADRSMMAVAPSPFYRPPSSVAAEAGPGTEDYKDWGKNPWVDASKDHLSTFAADVDTASYTIARRKLTEGQLPPVAFIKIEQITAFKVNASGQIGRASCRERVCLLV